MDRPRLFISAVTTELLGARQVVASAVRALGFDAVSQENFPTGSGELRQWLREQIDACEGLIQLVGHAYGDEPPTVESNGARVSYTQFEFLYAIERKKKTWVIVIGNDYPRDEALDQLDRPTDPVRPDQRGYQAERRALQESYVAGLKTANHLRHSANNPTELENVVLRLRDALAELRQQSARQRRHLTRAVGAILTVLILLIAGGFLAYYHLQRAVEQTAVVDTEKVRVHLLQAVEKTHRSELIEADRAVDWKERQRLRKAADAAHAARLAHIADVAASFAEIEGSGTTTDVFKELTRILTEQGVDEALAYMKSQRLSILQTVRTRANVARERNQADLRPLLQVAALHEAKAEIVDARGLYRDILNAEPDWPEALHRAFWFHIRQGDWSVTYGNLQSATRDYEEADELARRLTAGDRNNMEWQRALAVSLSKRGDVAMAQGYLTQAARAYTDTLAITKTLATGDPGNTLWQHDLSISYERVADVALEQGQFAEAARAYTDALAIAKKLAADEPNNTQRQRALSISYNKRGDVAVAQRQLAEARRAYTEALAIRKALAAADPSSTQWQRDLSVSYEKLGHLAMKQGQLAETGRAYTDALAIAKTLAAGEPSNTEWQRDLAVSYNNLGKAAESQGQLDEAARAYADALAIFKRLVAGDPSNTEWQRDLVVSYNNLGQVAERQRKPAESIAHFREALTLLSGLEARGLHLSPEDRQMLRRLRERSATSRR
jgi:tetratricopeptide (TPR) repeat protein